MKYTVEIELSDEHQRILRKHLNVKRLTPALVQRWLSSLGVAAIYDYQARDE